MSTKIKVSSNIDKKEEDNTVWKITNGNIIEMSPDNDKKESGLENNTVLELSIDGENRDIGEEERKKECNRKCQFWAIPIIFFLGGVCMITFAGIYISKYDQIRTEIMNNNAYIANVTSLITISSDHLQLIYYYMTSNMCTITLLYYKSVPFTYTLCIEDQNPCVRCDKLINSHENPLYIGSTILLIFGICCTLVSVMTPCLQTLYFTRSYRRQDVPIVANQQPSDPLAPLDNDQLKRSGLQG